MGALDGLLEQVKQAINNHAGNADGFDANKLIEHVTELFQKHPQNGGAQKVRPASEDPYGDPGEAPRNVKPATADPYGDPADERRH